MQGDEKGQFRAAASWSPEEVALSVLHGQSSVGLF